MNIRPAFSTTAGLLADCKPHHSRIDAPNTGVAGVVLEWEPVESSGADWRPDSRTVEQVAFYRAKVPGGWLVAMKGSYQAHGMGLAFYPDPLNAWKHACPHMADASGRRDGMT